MFLASSQSDFTYGRRTMRSRFPVIPCLAFAALLALPDAAQAQSVRRVSLVRNSPFPAAQTANPNATQGPEFDSVLVSGDADSGGDDSGGPPLHLNPSISNHPPTPLPPPPSPQAQ